MNKPFSCIGTVCPIIPINAWHLVSTKNPTIFQAAPVLPDAFNKGLSAPNPVEVG